MPIDPGVLEFGRASFESVGYLTIYGIGEGFSLIAVMREGFKMRVILGRITWGHFSVLTQH